MTHRTSVSSWLMACVMATGVMLPMLAGAQTQTTPSGWTMPRTVDGHPDLQGVWANNTATPLERPVELGDQDALSEEELATLQARYAQIFAAGESDAAFADSVFTAVLNGQGEFSSRDASTGNYNQFCRGELDIQSPS